MSRGKFFRKTFGGDEQSRRLQTNIEQAIAGAIKSEILDGRQIDNVALINGYTVIDHKLDRNLRGWILVDVQGAANIYRANSDEKILRLHSSAATTVSLWVY